MERSAGWVQLLDLDGKPLGRGHLKLREHPMRDGHPLWRGSLDWLRIAPSFRSPAPGVYRLRFEQAPDEHLVRIERFGTFGGSVRFAELSCIDDCPLPLTLSHVSGL